MAWEWPCLIGQTRTATTCFFSRFPSGWGESSTSTLIGSWLLAWAYSRRFWLCGCGGERQEDLCGGHRWFWSARRFCRACGSRTRGCYWASGELVSSSRSEEHTSELQSLRHL